MKQVIQPAAGAEFNRKFGFSAAIKSAPFIFVSGQVGSDADGNVPDDPATQFENAFTKLGAVLDAAGAGFEDIVEMTTYHVRACGITLRISSRSNRTTFPSRFRPGPRSACRNSRSPA